MQEKIIILIPVYNDWEALNILLPAISPINRNGFLLECLVVNDGSTDIIPTIAAKDMQVQLLHLTHNIGHQKALAIGLSYIYENMPCTKILIMDADGDDRMEDAMLLLSNASQYPDKIIMARRAKRKDSPDIRFFYSLYTWMFRLLTSKSIRYGNFCSIPFSLLDKIVYNGDTWMHLSASIIKSTIPHVSIDTSKGNRVTGKSKMNFTGLLMHGIGAIAVFTDIISLRLLVSSALFIVFSFVVLLAILVTKIFTSLAIPGWASSLGLSLVIIMLISFFISIFMIFVYIISQSYKKFIPALHYKDYLAKNNMFVKQKEI